MQIDVDAVRAHFPSLSRTLEGQPYAYFDGPGGSQVPQAVADAMTHAPEESQKVVSAIQEVIQAGNAAVAHSAQSAQKSIEIAQQYFHLLGEQAHKKSR